MNASIGLRCINVKCKREERYSGRITLEIREVSDKNSGRLGVVY